MNTIVTLIDFSGLTPKLIEQSERYAKALASRVILLHILPMEPVMMGMGDAFPAQQSRRDFLEADYQSLSGLGDMLRKVGVNVLIEQLPDADMRMALDECERWNADLIIVGAHHHSIVYNWFVGSFTCEVLKGAHCPVLVVPPIPVRGMGQ